LIGIELAKQIRRPGYWVVLAVAAGTSAIVSLIIALTSGGTPERLGDYGSVIPSSSGIAMAPITLNALLLFLLPLSAAIYAGEAVAGEAAWGSLRYLLARPVARRRVLTAKVVVAGLFSLAAVVVVPVTGLLAGLVAFGWHPLGIIDLQHASPFGSGLTSFGPLEGLGRIGLATMVVAATMASTFAFAILCSTVTDRPFAAVAGGVLLSFVSRSLDNIPGLHALGPWLPMTNRGAGLWTQLLFRPADLSAYPHLFGVQAVYVALFLGAAWIWFGHKDVLS
jgi:ABC-2 type transport system permease protein